MNAVLTPSMGHNDPLHCYAVGDRIETKRLIVDRDGAIRTGTLGYVADLCGPLHVMVRLAGMPRAIRLHKQAIVLLG